MLSADEVRAFAADLESDRIERTLSTTDTEKFREAICAFSNDMPGHGSPGYLLIGIDDSGRIVGAKVTDQLLQALAQRRDDGRIQPIPAMNVGKVEIGPGLVVAVVEVFPSESPPVRASGRVWIRIGPRRAIASAEEERRLTERRIARTRTFDQRPCPGLTLGELLLDSFRALYLPKVVAPEILAQNERSLEDRMASLRLYDLTSRAPTNAAVLLFGLDPLSSLPGAYVQFVRFDGIDLGAAVLDVKSLTGTWSPSFKNWTTCCRSRSGRPASPPRGCGTKRFRTIRCPRCGSACSMRSCTGITKERRLRCASTGFRPRRDPESRRAVRHGDASELRQGRRLSESPAGRGAERPRIRGQVWHRHRARTGCAAAQRKSRGGVHVRTRIRAGHDREAVMKTLVLFNNKSGVGKTTLVYHLAHMLARLGYRTSPWTWIRRPT